MTSVSKLIFSYDGSKNITRNLKLERLVHDVHIKYSVFSLSIDGSVIELTYTELAELIRMFEWMSE